MKIQLIILTAFVAALFSANTTTAQATELTLEEINALYKTKTHKTVSVHDPSAVHYQNNTFYVIGSHRGWARSTDNLVNWTSLDNGSLFGKLNASGRAVSVNYADAFSTHETRTVKTVINGEEQEVTFGPFDAKEWAHGDQSDWSIDGMMWAPDLIYNPNSGKWMMYMSLNGDYWHSVIVLLTADKITGPYVYQGPVHFSGFRNTTTPEISWKKTDLEIVLGEQSSLPSRYNRGNDWGTYWTNDIDPNVFFDEDGELWMDYGSWSGGIFMIKLDRQTGLRDYTYTFPIENDGNGRALSDPYFGKRIAGGYYSSGEGPYIHHMGDYYYLFVSYGGFAPDGGYEMRTFRSATPDGQYVDAGNLDACYHDRYWLNFGKNAQTNGGMKLMGAYNGWGLQTVGECAQGHNSVVTDEAGRNFVVYHTKFNDGTAGHCVRTRQLFLNEDGWLCAAPFEFDGETLTDADIKSGCDFTADEMAGSYDVLIHKYKMDYANMEEVTPITVRLTADGKVTGAKAGTWRLSEGTGFITLTLGGVTYKGVVVPQTLDGTTIPAVGITATAESGTSCGVQLWAYHIDPKYAVAYTVRANTPTFADGETVSANLDLPADAYLGAKIKWTSSNTDIITAKGRFTPPETSTEVTLTLTVTCDDVTYTQDYTLTAAGNDDLPDGDYLSDLVAWYAFTSKTAANRVNEEQRMAVKALGSGTAPTVGRDSDRSSYVLHQSFGTNDNCSYTLMDNPLKGLSSLKGMTIAMWVKMTSNNDWDAIWSFANKEANDATSRLFMTGNAYVGFNNGSGTWFDINHPNNAGSTKYLPADKWAFFTMTMTSSGIVLYVDGERKTQKSFAGSAAYSTALAFLRSAAYLQLGTGSFWGSADCYIDDLLVYKRALTADDVKLLTIMAGRTGTDYTYDAIDYVSLDESPRTSAEGIFDMSGRRVASSASLPRGVYIVNGKKVVVR